jgi:hypothetical protein
VFLTTIDKQILTMTLNTKFPVQPPPGNHPCKLKLSNQAGGTTQVTVLFEVVCDSYGKINSSVKLSEPPLNATIASISSSGLVTILWNTDMEV